MKFSGEYDSLTFKLQRYKCIVALPWQVQFNIWHLIELHTAVCKVE